jgi:hypothetical protein
MKYLLAGTALAVVLSTNAQAGVLTLQCEPPIPLVGASTGAIPQGARITIGDLQWSIQYTLPGGRAVARELQYDMFERKWNHWRGRLKTNPNLEMMGEFVWNDHKKMFYREWIWDHGQGNRLVMGSAAPCVRAETYAPPPVIKPQGTVESRLPPNAIPITLDPSDHRSIRVHVEMGTFSSDATLDTGASFVSMPQTAAASMVRAGEAHWLDQTQMRTADGRLVLVWKLVIHRLTLGSRTVYNVLATAAPDGADFLLGMSALDQFGPFTIDKQRGLLIFG